MSKIKILVRDSKVAERGKEEGSINFLKQLAKAATMCMGQES